ncbi:hypothetical protein [Wukongibacter sp. M2B1]|uniref:hypothetical protein n=1 Tax=Wukongibacter sp. M2B1 TaxID=3088895 RepID=UPI003D7A7254
MKVDIRVIKEPVSVEFDCPHCEEEIVIQYQYFCSEIGEVCDWRYSKFECPECNNTIEIDYVDWD